MAELLFANNAVATLAGAISSTATTAQLAAGTGTLFPNPAANQYFKLTFNDVATGLLREIVNVTAISGDTITAMTRAQEGTVALSWGAGDIAANLWTAGSAAALAQIESAVTEFTTHGTYTFIVPAGVFLLKRVRLIGAGGGGSGGGSSATWSAGGGGRTSTIAISATNGLAPGSGGGGIWGSSVSAANGGNGADGIVIIEY